MIIFTKSCHFGWIGFIHRVFNGVLYYFMKTLLPFLFILIHSFAFTQTKNVFFKIGTTGIGAGYEQIFNPKWSTSAAITYMDLSPSILLKGSEYQHRLKGTAKFVQLELAAKWHPRSNANMYGDTKSDKFYLNGGLLIRNNGKYVLVSDYQTVQPSNQFDANDPATGKINFNLKTNVVQPFLALGFEFIETDNGLCASIEAGLSYHGTSPTVPFVNFYETGNIKSFEPNFNKSERLSNMISLFKVYPLLNFNIGWKF